MFILLLLKLIKTVKSIPAYGTVVPNMMFRATSKSIRTEELKLKLKVIQQIINL